MNSDVDEDLLRDVSFLPKDILTLMDEDFFAVVQLLVGDSVADILRIQLINSARKLLSTTDAFLFFQIESLETDLIKRRSCFKSKTGQYIVKPGIRIGLFHLIKLLKLKAKQEQHSISDEDAESSGEYIAEDFLKRHPLLKSLIKWYKQSDSIDSRKHQFLTSFIDNLVNNLPLSPNRFRYNELTKKFAICLYILGGKQTYEFVRLNIYASIPNLSTLHDLINKSDVIGAEGQFGFQSLEKYASRFGFCSEDMTGVIRKVEYDSSSNSFVGFATPIIDGVPMAQSYQADTFDELKDIFQSTEIASLLNVHMFQSVPMLDSVTHAPKPCLLSAYGVNNKSNAMDILRRWIYMLKNCLDNGVRIIGFSTGIFIGIIVNERFFHSQIDADGKYMSAMRLVSGFFAPLSPLILENDEHAFEIDLPEDWTWFFLGKKQLFLFSQDPVHLVTKWRNRLLSSKAELHFGKYRITKGHIETLINDESLTKLDHGLTNSDINPKDRQNYRSCIKLISDDVIHLLADAGDSQGTVIYLKLLQMIVKAYITKSTSVRERKYITQIRN